MCDTIYRINAFLKKYWIHFKYLFAVNTVHRTGETKYLRCRLLCVNILVVVVLFDFVALLYPTLLLHYLLIYTHNTHNQLSKY